MVKDMDESEFRNTACIVYPAEYPSDRVQPKKENLHSTILFLGDIDEDMGGMDKDSLIDILGPIQTNVFQYVDVAPQFALFGPEKDIPVLSLIETDLLRTVHNNIQYELSKYGIYSPSEFGYSPHVTVDVDTYHMGNIPPWVLLRPPVLWYRSDVDVIGTARRQHEVPVR